MRCARVLGAGLGLLVVVSMLVESVLLTETAMLCLPFAFFPNVIQFRAATSNELRWCSCACCWLFCVCLDSERVSAVGWKR